MGRLIRIYRVCYQIPQEKRSPKHVYTTVVVHGGKADAIATLVRERSVDIKNVLTVEQVAFCTDLIVAA